MWCALGRIAGNERVEYWLHLAVVIGTPYEQGARGVLPRLI